MFAKIEGIKITAVAGCISKNQKSLYEHTEGLLSEAEIKRFNKKTGFQKLSITDENTTALDLCYKAADNLLKKINVDKNEIDAVIFVTTSPDYQLPNNSSIMQAKLGLSNNVIAFDINQGCPGFVQGLYTASSLIAGGGVNKLLLCVGDTRSKNTQVNDTATRVLFGDGGTATLIEKGTLSLYFMNETYGELFDKLIIEKSVSYDKNIIKMDGGAVANFVLDNVVPALKRMSEYYQFEIKDLGNIFIHQANKIFNKTISTLLSIPENKIPFLANEIGNTSNTSIALMLSDINKQDYDLDNVCLCAFGSGLSLAIVITDLSETEFLGIDSI